MRSVGDKRIKPAAPARDDVHRSRRPLPVWERRTVAHEAITRHADHDTAVMANTLQQAPLASTTTRGSSSSTIGFRDCLNAVQKAPTSHPGAPSPRSTLRHERTWSLPTSSSDTTYAPGPWQSPVAWADFAPIDRPAPYRPAADATDPLRTWTRHRPSIGSWSRRTARSWASSVRTVWRCV